MIHDVTNSEKIGKLRVSANFDPFKEKFVWSTVASAIIGKSNEAFSEDLVKLDPRINDDVRIGDRVEFYYSDPEDAEESTPGV